ncbi:hypothetical protein [Streptosporangium sp. NPDC006930]|uniref:hypothetical protein n=1 Tax=unclassified Streptosporangium TaxID=2632669 RepID=UPI00343E965F
MGDVKSYGSDCFFVDQWYARHKSGTPDVQGRTMLSERAREFPAALAFMLVLPPDEVRAALEERLAFLRARLSELEADLTEGGGSCPGSSWWSRSTSGPCSGPNSTMSAASSTTC